ncbi:MAG: hypothetical protein LBT24_06960 [Tannerella sp.]|jgi:hypothetical protein|nr:hypothetical protein [Tannerella sp.]
MDYQKAKERMEAKAKKMENGVKGFWQEYAYITIGRIVLNDIKNGNEELRLQMLKLAQTAGPVPDVKTVEIEGLITCLEAYN